MAVQGNGQRGRIRPGLRERVPHLHRRQDLSICANAAGHHDPTIGQQGGGVAVAGHTHGQNRLPGARAGAPSLGMGHGSAFEVKAAHHQQARIGQDSGAVLGTRLNQARHRRHAPLRILLDAGQHHGIAARGQARIQHAADDQHTTIGHEAGAVEQPGVGQGGRTLPLALGGVPQGQRGVSAVGPQFVRQHGLVTQAAGHEHLAIGQQGGRVQGPHRVWTLRRQGQTAPAPLGSVPKLGSGVRSGGVSPLLARLQGLVLGCLAVFAVHPGPIAVHQHGAIGQHGGGVPHVLRQVMPEGAQTARHHGWLVLGTGQQRWQKGHGRDHGQETLACTARTVQQAREAQGRSEQLGR